MLHFQIQDAVAIMLMRQLSYNERHMTVHNLVSKFGFKLEDTSLFAILRLKTFRRKFG